MRNLSSKLIHAHLHAKINLIQCEVTHMTTRMVQRKFDPDNIFSKEYKIGLKNISVHWHDFYEMDIVLSGTGKTICNGQTFSVERGLISFLSPMDFHEYIDCEHLELINIKFTEKDIDYELLSNFTNIKSNIVYAKPERLESIEILCNLMNTLDSGKFTKDYNKKLMECMIIAFLGCCSQKTNRDFESEIIQKAVIYINAHFRENPKMREMAELCHLNENYFCRIFKKCVGMNYKEYVKKLKLDYALRLIMNTSLPITTIAINCGYDTQSHFNREFKSHFQKSPTHFRSKK